MKSLYRKIAITTGDANGIGFEVVAKSLNKLTPSIKKNRAIFFIFRSKSQEKIQKKYFKLIDKKWNRFEFSSLEASLNFLKNTKNLPDRLLIDLALETNEAEWVRQAAAACKDKLLTSLVTGPLSKKISVTLDAKPMGHTGIFRNMFPLQKMHMGFIGKNFNVLLATDHIPLDRVEEVLKNGAFSDALDSAIKLRTLLRDKRKIGVLGLNPHAGELGLIGDAERLLFTKLPRVFEGPLVPDAAFLKKNWKKYSLFLCLYHDQGLIPFKLQHGQDSGVHITLGLPFLRTSVDHGTAVDIFNKNIANPASMLEAIHLNLHLAGAKYV